MVPDLLFEPSKNSSTCLHYTKKESSVGASGWLGALKPVSSLWSNVIAGNAILQIYLPCALMGIGSFTTGLRPGISGQSGREGRSAAMFHALP
jgi:hypothetical protein